MKAGEARKIKANTDIAGCWSIDRYIDIIKVQVK